MLELLPEDVDEDEEPELDDDEDPDVEVGARLVLLPGVEATPPQPTSVAAVSITRQVFTSDAEHLLTAELF